MNNSTNNNVSIPTLIRITQANNTSTNARNDATQKLKYLEDQRFADYILELCRILGSRQEQQTVRMGAGLLLKNCIGAAAERSEQYINKIRKRWEDQESNVRNRLKTTIIAILGVPDRAARDTAINVISNLASIESISQQNGWNDLIPQLIKKCLTQNSNDLTYSALKCIAQIAENEAHHDDLQRYSPKILECIASGMSKNSGQNVMDVQTQAMKCLYHFVALIGPNMKIEKERTIIFQMVCCGANQAGNKELKLSSFMVISQLIEYYYDLLSAYMQHIFQISKSTIEKGINNQEDEDVTKQAIEVWSTCAEIEFNIKQDELENNNNNNDKQQNFGFVNKSLELLVPIYLKALLKQKEDFDPDEWTIRKAAACSLELFALVAGDNILTFVLKFVEQNISLSNWRGREAALGAFGYILDGPSQNKLVQLTSQILPIILKLMGDGHIQVRTTAVWAFGRVCDLIPDAVGNKNILEPLVKALGDKNEICNKACWCIASLTKYYNVKKINGSCIYSEANAFKLIKELLTRCGRRDCDGNVVIALHEAINNIIYYLPGNERNAQNIKSLLPELVSQMLDCSKKCMDNNNNNGQSMDIVMHRMAGLFSSIQVILDKLGQNCLDEELTNKIMHCCCALLSKDNDLVYEEALGCITYVARCIGPNFKVYLEAQNVQQLLIKSIRIGSKNKEICRIGAGVIGDVYTSCTDYISNDPMKLQSYTDRIVSELLTILIQPNNDDLSIQLKGHIVDALTDILIAHGRHAYRYSGDILDKCLQIGCLKPPQDWDQDQMTDFNEIRCSIIDTCRTCMAELAQAGQIGNFGTQYLPKIHLFFNAISEGINKISINVLRSCIKLLHEAADYCDANTKRKLQTQAVQNILSKAGSMTQNEPDLAAQAKQAFQNISTN